ncbi:TadE/TadG family type IV pilus assembly protein [Novosphingobium sp.]|uniref:TadE/TadG family type IV pilus assembly protein n=1 Tax=Novosphingobium sp. TaxID=1874826 RepID=UPI003BAB300E
MAHRSLSLTLRRMCRSALLRDSHAVSAVEFGLTAPILFLVVFGSLQVAQGYYVRTVLTGSINAAARKSTLQTGQTNSTTLDTLVATSIKYVMPTASITFTRKNYADFTSVGTPEDFTDTNKNGKYDSTECFVDMNGNGVWDADMGKSGLGGANDIVVYTVSVSYKQWFGFAKMFGLPEYQTIPQTTILKNQPFATQATRTGTSICP